MHKKGEARLPAHLPIPTLWRGPVEGGAAFSPPLVLCIGAAQTLLGVVGVAVLMPREPRSVAADKALVIQHAREDFPFGIELLRWVRE
jgi:hypothetical protein